VIVGSQKVLDQMRNDVMRIARLYGADMNQPAKREMIELLWLWNKLGDAPTFTESTDEYDVDSIEVPFLHFSVGTHREDVWRWFEAQNPDFLVTDAMYRKHRLAFSAGEAQTGGDGAGFWSNEDGWVVLQGATVFHQDQISELMRRLPKSSFNDVVWLTFNEALNKIPAQQEADVAAGLTPATSPHCITLSFR